MAAAKVEPPRLRDRRGRRRNRQQEQGQEEGEAEAEAGAEAEADAEGAVASDTLEAPAIPTGLDALRPCACACTYALLERVLARASSGEERGRAGAGAVTAGQRMGFWAARGGTMVSGAEGVPAPSLPLCFCVLGTLALARWMPSALRASGPAG